MRMRMATGVLAVASAAALTGCGGGGTKADGPAKPEAQAATAAEPVEIVQKVRGDNPALTRSEVRLLKTEADLAALGVDNLEGLAVDWPTQDVVLLALGEQPTGGYWADITGVQLVGGALYVQGIANAPGEGGMATQQLTYPFAAAVVAETGATRALSDIDSVEGQDAPQ